MHTSISKTMALLGALSLAMTMLPADTMADSGRHGGPGGGFQAFEAFDANEDGKLTQAEVDQVRTQRLSEFDTDGDAQLTLQEYEALWMDAMRERMVDQFQRHDDDGDGIVTNEEFVGSYSRLVLRLDENGDGEVTREELRRGRRGDGRRSR